LTDYLKKEKPEGEWRTVGAVSVVEARLAGACVRLFQRNATTAVSTRLSRADVSITVVDVCTARRIFRQLQQPVINFHLQRMPTSAPLVQPKEVVFLKNFFERACFLHIKVAFYKLMYPVPPVLKFTQNEWQFVSSILLLVSVTC